MDHQERQELRQARSEAQKTKRRKDGKIREDGVVPGSGEEFGNALLTLAAQLRQKDPNLTLSQVHDHLMNNGDIDSNGDVALTERAKPATLR